MRVQHKVLVDKALDKNSIEAHEYFILLVRRGLPSIILHVLVSKMGRCEKNLRDPCSRNAIYL